MFISFINILLHDIIAKKIALFTKESLDTGFRKYVTSVLETDVDLDYIIYHYSY